ncbi:hypothetical protein B0H11DRAFT_1859027 [Mycena galericulata]|nr:hypothetical protein B0H11DRAFT_1859027 [Mycena galericulata]
MKLITITIFVAFLLYTGWAHPLTVTESDLYRRSGHAFTLVNNCTNEIQPVIADTRCGYSPRCAGAASYTGPQPNSIPGQGSIPVTIPSAWVGRIFATVPSCGPKGENCTVTEFNLDTGSQYTAQSYDISNIQGFTQSRSLPKGPTHTMTCTNATCGCANAYPVGDTTGCGDDEPVQACGPGDVAFTITFCP